jgi:hypothetical protein
MGCRDEQWQNIVSSGEKNGPSKQLTAAELKKYIGSDRID